MVNHWAIERLEAPVLPPDDCSGVNVQNFPRGKAPRNKSGALIFYQGVVFVSMTTREFIQHLILNGELDEPVIIEVDIPEGVSGYTCFEPAHVTRIGTEDQPETLIECKPWRE